MQYTIYRNNAALAVVEPSDSSELQQKKQSEDIIRMSFTLVDFLNLQIGDYIVYPPTAQKYVLNKKPRVTESPKNNVYECIFEGGIHEFRKTKTFLQTGTYKDYKFPLTGNAQTFLSFIVSNLTGYTAGTFAATETTTINFNNWDIFTSIAEICKTLGCDWYLDGKVLHFDNSTAIVARTFQVGRLAGFTQLTSTRVESENIETVVYGYGSTANLPPREQYDSELLTENRLFFSGVGGESKLENNTDKYGRIESVQEFDDIKPERTGSVTALSDVNSFFDSTLDFDIQQQLLEGIKPKLTFLTGKLIGLNFDISSDFATKKITLDFYSDESGTYPSTLIDIGVGDTYKLFDLQMPDSYIVDAATRLEAATQAYIDKQSSGLEFFEGVIDKQYIELYGINLKIGDIIRIVSDKFEIDNDYEIKELTQNINNPAIYSVKFGDVLPRNLLTALRSANFSTQQQIYNVQRTTYTTTETTNQVTNITNEATEWQTL